MIPRRFLFYLGWALLLAAFAAGAAEALVRTDPSRGLSLVSAHDLWYRFWPGKLVVAEIKVERLSPALWSDVVRPLLEIPAWMLTGIPGALMTWFCRPVRQMTPDEEQDMREREESFFLYDALAEQAIADGHGHGDDMAPDHGFQQLLEEGGITVVDSEVDFEIDTLDMPPPPGGGDR
ncbi:MAG: hypothetical protein VW268_11945 [Rhodospirillaceae bacterium]